LNDAGVFLYKHQLKRDPPTISRGHGVNAKKFCDEFHRTSRPTRLIPVGCWWRFFHRL